MTPDTKETDRGKRGPLRHADCVICETRPSTRRGEHVWPQWYMRAPIHGPGPYPWSVGNEPILRRDGRPVAPPVLTRVKLPVCRQCNGELDRRFEKAGSSVMRDIFEKQGRLNLTSGAAESAGLWLLKTWLLLSHPRIHYSEPLIDRLDIIRDRRALPQEYYRWLVTGLQPPAGLSLWVSRTMDDGQTARSGPIIPLPEVHAGGEIVSFEAHQVTLHGLTIVLVFHPGWPLVHPYESSGGAQRLWPSPGAINLEMLASIPLSAVPRWAEGWRVVLKPGALGDGSLPALGSEPDPIRFFTRVGASLASSTRLIGR